MGKKWRRTVLALMMAVTMAGSAFVVPAFAEGDIPAVTKDEMSVLVRTDDEVMSYSYSTYALTADNTSNATSVDLNNITTAEEFEIAITKQAKSGDTIKLANDITYSSDSGLPWMPDGVTLDLNTHTLTSENLIAVGVWTGETFTVKNGILTGGSVATVYNCGNLTIKNCIINTKTCEGVVNVKSGCSLILENTTITATATKCSGIVDQGTGNSITMTNCNVTGDCWAVYHNGSNAGFEMIAKNCTFTCDDVPAIYIAGSTTTTADAGKNHQLTLTDCTVTGATGIEGKYTDMFLTNCSITATAEESYVQSGNGSTTKGFAVVATDNSVGVSPKPSGTITINGGNYDGPIGLNQLEPDKVSDELAKLVAGLDEADYIVSAGTFNCDVSDYLADSVEATLARDGKVTVYGDVKEALKDANNGGTITAYKNVTVPVSGNNVTIKPGKDNVIVSVDTTKVVDGYEVTDNGDGTITVNPKDTYTVTVNDKIVENAYEGKEVTISAPAVNGYKFAYWSVISGDVELKDMYAETTTFIMPAGVVKFEANYIPDQQYYPTYPTYDTGSTVTEKDGWTDLSAGSVYYKNGIKVKGWQDIDGETYYFDKKGYLQTGWLELEDSWYYLDPADGAQQTGWEKIGNTWYYLDRKTGVMESGGMKTIDGETYYFYDWGGMASSWWYLDEETGAWYFFRGNGAMAKGAWIEWKGEYYYCGADGRMLTSTTTPDGYRVDQNGKWIR